VGEKLSPLPRFAATSACGRSAYGQFLLAMILMSWACNSTGLVVGALIPHPTIAVTLAPLSIIPFMLVCGFFITLSSIPGYLRWLSAISPHRYVFASLLRSELHGMAFDCLPDELFVISQPDGSQAGVCMVTNGDMVLQTYQIDVSASGFETDMLAMLGLFIGFRLLAYLALRLASSPKD
jgi:hypothetical protein